MTYQQRFFVTSSGNTFYAPSTIGCPSMLIDIDRKVFQKTKEEKALLAKLKMHHPKSRTHKFKTVLLVRQ